MKELMRWAMLVSLTVALTSCGGQSRTDEDDMSLGEPDVTDASEAAPSAEASGSEPADEFAEFEDRPEQQAQPQEQAPAQAAAPADDMELSLDEEEPATQAEQPVPQEPAPTEQAQSEPVPEEPPAVAMPEEEPEQAQVPPPAPEATPEPPVPSHVAGSTITSIKYKANDAGGTVVIEANGPITYTTRSNPELRQMIIEVPDAILPKRLQRPLNTRDIQGHIGAIDPYQNSGSNVARFVIQLREGVQEPVVQQEGNTLLVVAATAAGAGSEESGTAMTRGETQMNVELNDSKILSSQSLSEYLSGNTKFYGKKISIEMNSVDIREVLRFIMEESGVNMVIADEVKGTVSVKLRQVPWDQALVVVMRANQLGYTRQGSVLRIAPLDQLKKEEDDATKIALAKKDVEPLKVRVFPISYARVTELEKKVKDFLTEKRGKVVGDERTNSLVVTDIEENLQRIAKLVQSLDSQPPQVLIEGKIVEAAESFQRAVGINWGMTGSDIKLANGKYGPVNMRPTLSIGPSLPAGPALGFNLSLGTLDGFGDLTATLALNEKDEKVKILSSPRIVTLSNEQADISQTNEVPIRTVTQNGTATVETFTFKPLSLRLEVTPQITSDASVIMKVKVKREFKGADLASGGFPVNAREANTRVLVRNGSTAVIGGIYQSDATEGQSGVPWLKDLPMVGAFFRSRTTDRQKTELLVFLTPRILTTSESTAPSAAPPPTDLNGGFE